MSSAEPKKLALIRIWQILKEYSDYDHPMTQDDIVKRLEKDYGIALERKAVSRNISLLKEAGVEIESGRAGSYIECRDFEDSELHMLIDGVLSSKHITAVHSKDLIERLCGLSNKYFRSSVKHIYSVDDWSKTDNQELFYNIELISAAIEEGHQIYYNYNKYGMDKELHRTSKQYVSPYQMILHNQRYYLVAYSEYWGNMVFHRLDRITNMIITERIAIPIKSVPGYENGINYKKISSSMPYLYSDTPERIELIADKSITDQIVDWFGQEVEIGKCGSDESKVLVNIKASPKAMEHWAMQYIKHVEITFPETLRERIRGMLKDAENKYF
jgi:predicted DNA-binding transcriptional regulator YafY